jgi:two-component system phosphate regulon response regulator PhoB
MSERILAVDDEADLLELVEYNLREAGYAVTTAKDGAGALAEVRRQRPDLILLDLMLPDLSGTEICKRLRRDPETEGIPIELGADDYIVQPFSPRELVLRIGAVLRRAQTPQVADTTQRIVLGKLSIDVARHRVAVEDEDIPLTALEFKLLLDLASRRGRVQSRDALLDRVWGYAPGIETRTVDTHVKRLREKLGAASDYIETVRGIGYRMREDLGVPASA